MHAVVQVLQAAVQVSKYGGIHNGVAILADFRSRGRVRVFVARGCVRVFVAVQEGQATFTTSDDSRLESPHGGLAEILRAEEALEDLERIRLVGGGVVSVMGRWREVARRQRGGLGTHVGIRLLIRVRVVGGRGRAQLGVVDGRAIRLRRGVVTVVAVLS